MNLSHFRTLIWLRWRLTRNQWRRTGQLNTVIMLIAVVVKFLSNRISKNLRLFNGFFSRAATGASSIDLDQVHFTEFLQLAESANEMVANRRRVEKALRESEEKYRRIFEDSVVGFFQSTPAGRFISVNPAFAGMLGYDSPDDLITTITDIATQYYLRPEDRQQYQAILQRDGKVEGFEFEACCKDGSSLWLSNSTRAYFDDDGRVVRYEGVVRTITKRKLAENALRESEARLTQIIMGSPVPTFVIDNHHRTTHWNRALEEVTGISGNQVIGTNKQWMAFYANERPVMADLIVDEVDDDEVFRYYRGKLQPVTGLESA